MPVSLFSPLTRGFSTWTGELHLANDDKGPGPSLPSLLPEDPYCHHSGVTVKPRAKSAVSAFSARNAPQSPGRQSAWQEKPDGELVLPKTYLTKKGAIVLYAAPDDTSNIELSERDKLYLKKARRKLLKHRYVEYSNKFGSIQRLAQSVLSFGDEEGYDKENDSISDADSKMYLKFTRDESDREVFDKHSQPGGNIDMYLNDLMSHSGTRPSTAIIDWRSSADLGQRPDSVASSVDSSKADLLTADSDQLVRSIGQPPPTTPRIGFEGGRHSPSTPSSRTKKLSAGQLAASLKSGGFLGRQTIIEEIDSVSESSSHPMTPANTMSRPQSCGSITSYGTRSRPPSREKLLNQRKRSVVDETLTERSKEMSDTMSNISEIKSNKLSRRSASSSTSALRKERINMQQESLSHHSSAADDYDQEIKEEIEEEYIKKENSDEYNQLDYAEEEIQRIENESDENDVRNTYLESDAASRSKSESGTKSRRESVHSRRKSRSSSTVSFNKDQLRAGTPEVQGSVGREGDEEEFFLSENEDYEEEEDIEWDHQDGPTQPLMPSYSNVLDISLLSGGSGGGTFSMDATTADNVPEDQVFVDDPVAQVLSKQGSRASMRSDHQSSLTSSVSQTPLSRPQSTVEHPPSPTRTLEEHLEVQEQEEFEAQSSVTIEQKSQSPKLSMKEASEEEQQNLRVKSVETDVKAKDTAEEERPDSVASSHSGVPSESGEEPQLKTEGKQPSEQPGIGEAVNAETLDEAATEHQPEPDTAKEIQPLPDYLKVENNDVEKAESVAESVEKAPSSYTSSVATQDLPPEPGVTEVHITPRSSAVSTRTEPTPPVEVVQKATEPETKQKSSAIKEPEVKLPITAKEETKATTAQKQDVTKVTKEKKLDEENKKPVTPAAPATHMTQAKKEPPAPKIPPSKPVKEKKQPAEPVKPVSKKEETKPNVIEKKSKQEEKKAEKEKKEKEKAVSKKEKEKAEKSAKEKEKTDKAELPKKEYTKVLEINNYDQFEKKIETKEKEEPKVQPKEIKPESLVSDTKAEIQRLFGSVPVKKESAREKKERMKREMGPRIIPRTPKPPAEPKPKGPSKEEKELEQLEQKVMEAIGDVTSAIPVDEEGGGLTVEEMELEQELLQQKLAEADAKLKGQESPKTARKATVKDTKKSKGTKKGKGEDEEDIAAKREALREAKRLEKQKRLEEAKRIEEELKVKEAEKKRALQNAAARTAYLNEDIEEMKRQAEQAEIAEEDAREVLAEARKQAREERERRRKEEQERKKNDAVQKRENEKKRLEAGRQREQDMLMRLATQEERKKIAEENRRRREEEEEKAMMEEEEEERLAKKKAEEDESRIAEFERQAEEEALTRLVQEREEALRKKRQMEEMQRKLAEEEEQKRKEYEEEQRKIEELRLKKEEEERLRREEEKRRLLELQRMEDEAREKMKQEMQRRREALLRRRDQNVERRSNLDSLKQKQGMTKGWVFSYYVQWPRETYERRMGGSDEKKKKRGKSAPAKTRPTHS